MSPVSHVPEDSQDTPSEPPYVKRASRAVRWISFLLGRRYFTTPYGDPIPQAGGPYLILANHPALIDPILVYTHFAHLRPRPVMDENVFKRFRYMAKRFDPIIVPDLSRGGDPAAMEQVVNQAVESLAQGRNVLMWPGGSLQREGRDVLKGKSGVWRIMKAMENRGLERPELILVRTEGLWGSRFSRYLDVDERMGVVRTLLKLLPPFLLFGPFLPRRRVRLMLRRHTPSAAECASVERINAIISAWFLAGNQNAVLVPVVPGVMPVRLPVISEPDEVSPDVDLSPALLLLEPYGAAVGMGGDMRLREDLGIDSLTMVQVILQIESACGYAPAPAELRTVSDVALLLLNKTLPASLPVLAEVEAASIRIPPLVPIHELFSRRGDVTDVTLGAHFPRSALMGYAKAVSTLLHDLPCRTVGIALPAGAAAMAAFAGCLGAGRTPVMLNYSMDSIQLAHCARLAEVTHVLTSRRMYGRGVPPGAQAAYLEDMDTSRLGRTAFASIFGFDWSGDLDATAVILFTSGSEALPKAVPLTHRNVMSNLRDLLSMCMGEPLNVRRMSLLCCLPGFHSLGFLSNILLPLVCGVPSVCIADPANAPALARAAVEYKTSMFMSTPGFLHGILQAAQETLPFRQVMIGAEDCSQATKELFAERCPEGRLIEGYGVTECSPVISLNVEGRPGSVGRILPGLECRIYEEQLYVRGESVFSGYLDGTDPRVRISASAHADWYPTGDLFRIEEGALYFLGRARRFVKRAGEMVSLAAMETVLRAGQEQNPHLALIDDPQGRIIAVGPEQMDIGELNAMLRKAGFASLWKVDEVRECVLPMLGTGKIDYQALKQEVAQDTE
ncbi:MAG: AMP-binding protein [Deltaproteobacteria bacterium]|jgi:acyl-CoA synthetase (AMP-forming)/AMP-acid ligase II/1-acyl-sn-glycerol-3-phosphate acyltransferase|nr:AMP-binding protein [Deltaproteobacteria bacterium]